MKDVIIIGLAVTGLFTLGIDYFLLESFAVSNIEEARRELWIKAGIAYLVLLIPPYIFNSRARLDKAKEIMEVGGLVIVDLAKYISIGFLLFLGWYLANTIFSA